MAEQKTKPTTVSVTEFLDAVPDENKRKDAHALAALMEKETGYPAVMWGPGIVGFGSYHYKYDSGHEGDAPLVGFSPRKDAISLYAMPPQEERDALLAKLGKHKAAKGCIYIKKLSDVNEEALKAMIKSAVRYLQEKYPG